MLVMRTKLLAVVAIVMMCGSATFTSCTRVDNVVTTQTKKEYFTLWNDCEALTALKGYVEDVTNPKSKNYIKVEDRIATFDMDGTLIAELYPTYFEYNMLEYRALDDPTYRDVAPQDVREAAQAIRDFVRTGKKLSDNFALVHAHAAAKAYSGMTVADFDAYVKAFASRPANGFTGMTNAGSFYKPMLQVIDYLHANNFDVYVVSGSDRALCRSLFSTVGVEPNKVIGMDVKYRSDAQGDVDGIDYTMGVDETLVRTDELIIKTLKTNKVLMINEEIGKVPVLSFGNTDGDCAMHNYCLGNKKYKTAAFMLIADDEARDHAKREKGLQMGEKWRQAGYHVISMHDDFRTIYGNGVVKTDFSF